jgi:hypothetical protein
MFSEVPKTEGNQNELNVLENKQSSRLRTDRSSPLCLHFVYQSREFHEKVTEESYEANCVVEICEMCYHVGG